MFWLPLPTTALLIPTLTQVSLQLVIFFGVYFDDTNAAMAMVMGGQRMLACVRPIPGSNSAPTPIAITAIRLIC